MLLESCDLHTILILPSGVFTGAAVKTVILFFEKGRPTKDIWYYQLNLDRNLGKNDPLSEEDLSEFLDLQKTKVDSLNSWTEKFADIDPGMLDLSDRNPNRIDQVELRDPHEILEKITQLDQEARQIFNEIKDLL